VNETEAQAGVPTGAPAASAAEVARVPRPRRGQPLARPSRTRLAVRAFARDRIAVVALAVLLLVVLASVLAPLLAPFSPTAGDASLRLEGIGTPGHPLGLDGQGRDVLSRLLWGGRNSLAVAVVPVLVVFPIALLAGLVAGYTRGHVGDLIMRLLDVLFAFPLVLLAIALAAVLGAGLGNVMLAIGITLIPYMARVAYTTTVQEVGKEYVVALSFNLIGDGLRDALDPRKQTT
jgi:ABC-type dipeptide/oligopeptide/nickel transport system permease subunit